MGKSKPLPWGLADMKKLQDEIAVMQPGDMLYKFLKHALKPRGNWKSQPRGDKGSNLNFSKKA